MKKYGLLVLAITFVFNFSISAQDQMPPKGENGHRKEMKRGERPQMTPAMRAERMAKDLNLTEAEKVKVKELFESEKVKLQKNAEQNSKTREEMKAKFEAEKKAHDAELQKIIGTEKFQQLQQLKIERLEKLVKMKQNSKKGKRANQSANEPAQ